MTSPPRSRATALDVPGGLLSAGGLAGLVFGFSEASTRGWGSGLTVGLLAAGAVTHGSYGAVVVPGFVLLGLGAGSAVATAFSLGPAGARPADAGVAAALVNASNQVGGSIGAALLNTIAASATAAYLAGHAAGRNPLDATVHGDVVAFTFLIALFAAGAVATGLLYPRQARVDARRPVPPGPVPPAPAPAASPA